MVVFFDFVVNGIEPDNGINGFQVAFTPACSSGSNLSVRALSVPLDSSMSYSSAMCPRIS